ncbi:hypothetical protein [Haloplanus halophilus]|uniref:hypothetical protein n=1 Tax=Haloplanus halophilus TaxID=2949993 RepID=UPI00203DE3C0|nr:hypothetical protein [Haloplanus sp. GDY1]
MQRRKFIAGVGSLAAGAAAVTGTGAFTSVQADRSLTINTRYNSDALLGLGAEDSENGDEYVVNPGASGSNGIAIDLGDADGDSVGDGSGNPYGVNGNALTIIRDLIYVKNQGSQEVYVHFEGLPNNVRVFHDDSSFPKGEDGGAYTGNLSNPGTGRFQPDDPDASESNNYFKLPDLSPGDTLENIGLLIDTTSGNVQFSGDITIVAETLEEAES